MCCRVCQPACAAVVGCCGWRAAPAVLASWRRNPSRLAPPRAVLLRPAVVREQKCAQVLLTLDNLANRGQYINAKNTFEELLR